MALALFGDKLGFDPFRDITPIGKIVDSTQMIVAHPSLGVKSIAELVALAKAKPNTLTYASFGVGTYAHLSMEDFKKRTGTEITHVPYRGAVPAATDLMGGHIETMLPDLPGVIALIQAGSIRALAVTSAKRSPVLPDVPTTAEAGYPNVLSDSWYGLIAPVATPADIKAKLYAAASEAMKTPAFLEQMKTQAAMAAPGSSQEFASMIADEQTRWKRVIEATGAKME